jgi:flagellar basal body rod protein FlgB
MSEPVYKVEMFDDTFNNVEMALNRATKKQAIIAQNIANAGNPNYIPKDFDEVLNKAVERKNKNIVIEEEMATLSKNAIDHSAYVKLLASKIGVLRTVVTQGRK